MKTATAVRSGQVLVLTSDEALGRMVLDLSRDLAANAQSVGDLEELRALLVPGGALEAPPGHGNGGTAKVVLVDEREEERDGEAWLDEILGLRPSVKVIYVSRRLDPAREIDLRLRGVFFLMARPVEASLLRRVLARAIEHETTRWKRASGGDR